MSALHQAVARAIADTPIRTDGSPVPQAGLTHAELDDLELRRAAAAVRVVLAEATRSIEALQAEAKPFAHGGGPYSYSGALAEALAVLAALGGEA